MCVYIYMYIYICSWPVSHFYILIDTNFGGQMAYAKVVIKFYNFVG
jgi:hypothetical protein